MGMSVVIKVEDGLTLRSFESADAELFFRLIDRNRMYLRRWLPWLDTAKTVDDTRFFVDSAMQQRAANNGFQAGLWAHDQPLGVIGYHRIDWPNRSTSLGYWLGEEFQGRGLMSKACRAMVSYAFDEFHLHRMEIRCAVHNVKSRAIPERLGFRREGTMHDAEWLYDRFVDHAVYGMLAPEWFEREAGHQASGTETAR